MTEAPHRTTFSLEYDDERQARIVEASVGQEIGEIDDDRSRTAIECEATTLRIVIEAADLVALRAASNTWLTLVDVAERSASL